MNLSPQILSAALRPLDDPPGAPGWNRGLLASMDIALDERPAAVLLALHGDDDQCELLFTRRADGLAHHAGQISFPGGRIDPGDRDAVDAALREAHEEIALPASSVTPLGYLDCLETISGFCITPVVARVHGNPPLRAEPAEVAEVFSAPLSYVLDPRNLVDRPYPTASGERLLPEVHYAGHRIWGATAMILANLRRRLTTT